LYLGGAGKIYKYDAQKRKIVKTIVTPTSKVTVLVDTSLFKMEVGFLKPVSGNVFLVQSNSSTYLYNDYTSAFTKLGPSTYINNAALFDNILYLASPNVSYWYNIIKPGSADSSLVPKDLHSYSQNRTSPFPDIAVIPGANKIVFATQKKLFEYGNGKSKYLTFHNRPIIASAICYTDSKLFIATTNHGLLKYENNRIIQLISSDAIGPEQVLAIKQIGDNLWLLNTGPVKIINIKTEKLIRNNLTNDYYLSDVTSIGDIAYFVSTNKLYSLNIRRDTVQETLNCKNLYTIINGRDTIFKTSITVPHNKNDFQFNLSYPVFGSTKKTKFKYRLTGAGDSEWRFTDASGGVIRFASLKPGKYVFEAYALHPNLGDSQNKIFSQFTILPPWWETWIFRSLTALFAFILTIFFISFYYRSKLSKQKVFFESKLAMEKERQRISREIHDDIGQSLSVIKLNLNMGTPEQLQEAKEIISYVIKDIRELTHTLYYGKNLIEDLIASLQKDVTKLNAAAQESIRLEINGNEISLTDRQKSGVYRIYQEAINNILKHAQAKNIRVGLNVDLNNFTMNISDDGCGFDQIKGNKGLGLLNMQARAKEIGGSLSIISELNEGTRIQLLIPHNHKR
jgi:signal transduction histidine kinase